MAAEVLTLIIGRTESIDRQQLAAPRYGAVVSNLTTQYVRVPGASQEFVGPGQVGVTVGLSGVQTISARFEAPAGVTPPAKVTGQVATITILESSSIVPAAGVVNSYLPAPAMVARISNNGLPLPVGQSTTNFSAPVGAASLLVEWDGAISVGLSGTLTVSGTNDYGQQFVLARVVATDGRLTTAGRISVNLGASYGAYQTIPSGLSVSVIVDAGVTPPAVSEVLVTALPYPVSINPQTPDGTSVAPVNVSLGLTATANYQQVYSISLGALAAGFNPVISGTQRRYFTASWEMGGFNLAKFSGYNFAARDASLPNNVIFLRTMLVGVPANTAQHFDYPATSSGIALADLYQLFRGAGLPIPATYDLGFGVEGGGADPNIAIRGTIYGI